MAEIRLHHGADSGGILNEDRQILEDKGSIHTGTINFSIRLANELTGSDTILFAGKMQVGKARSNEAGPKAANHFVYYVDHDWNLPIGYIFYERNDNWNEGDPLRWSKPMQIVGDHDGPWDRNAWKTGAFYGNPLAGFSVP